MKTAVTTLLGAWNGIDPVTGMSDKEITELKPTDKIPPIILIKP
ncbi:MAG: hypothetical protein ACLSB9_27050 [Hydrogeniiclostridium mannosilyticum]